mgnify:CR=1 FL=1
MSTSTTTPSPVRRALKRRKELIMVAILAIVGLTLLIGAGLWPLYASGPGDAVSDLLTLTLRMLSALTVPHVLLDRLSGRQHGCP